MRGNPSPFHSSVTGQCTQHQHSLSQLQHGCQPCPGWWRLEVRNFRARSPGILANDHRSSITPRHILHEPVLAVRRGSVYTGPVSTPIACASGNRPLVKATGATLLSSFYKCVLLLPSFLPSCLAPGIRSSLIRLPAHPSPSYSASSPWTPRTSSSSSPSAAPKAPASASPPPSANSSSLPTVCEARSCHAGFYSA